MAGALAVLWCVAALLIYKPFAPSPFDILDFPEFLPVLRATDGMGDRMVAIIDYYVSRGRSSVATYALLVLNYELWGENAVGWQVMRSLEFAIGGILMFLLLRRWRATELGAGAGAMLVVCARSAAPNWSRLVASEPVSLIVILALFWLATGFRDAENPRARISALALGIGLLIFLKEIFFVLLPAVWTVASLTDREGRWEWEKPKRRLWWLYFITTGVAIICLTPVIFIVVNAPLDSYATLYGEGRFSFGTAVARYLSTVIPFPLVTTGSNIAVSIADCSFLLLLAIGWRLFFQQIDSSRSAGLLMLFSFSIPMLGVLSYLPWPSFQDFYGLPYLIGTATLIAVAVTGIELKARRGVTLAFALLIVPYALMMTSSHFVAGRSRAAITVAHTATRLLSETPPVDTVVIAVRNLPVRNWFGLGATLQRQAIVNGEPFPAFKELPCDSAQALLTGSTMSTRVLALHSHCTLKSADHFSHRQIVERFSWFDWGRWAVVRDSVSADYFESPRSRLSSN